jgi:two-component system, LytTR family, sensor kinase
MTTALTSLDKPAVPFRLRRAELLGIFAFWTFVAVLSSAGQLLDPRGGPLQPVLPAAPFAFAFIQAYLWAALTPVIFWLAARFPLDRAHAVRNAILLLLIALLVAGTVDVILSALRLNVFFEPRGPRFPGRPPPGIFFGLRRFWFFDDMTVFVGVLAAGFAREYFLRYQNRQTEARRLEAESAELKVQLAEAHLAALRTQLNPHFLFNTLNAVSALVERDPSGVRRMIARLSDLLRRSFEAGAVQQVTLREELDFVRRYFEIMEIRFPDTIDVRIRVHPDLLDALVPNLLLQPLVENAIKHAGASMTEPLVVQVSARATRTCLVLRVRDNGPGLRIDYREGSGVGLRNTSERLRALHGEEQKLIVRTAAPRGTLAEVVLPYVENTDR